jgi:NRPS condensation-like uncharacterized protein
MKNRESEYQLKKEHSGRKPWMPLDNTARIYPSLLKFRNTGVYRFSANLLMEVQPVLLERALLKALEDNPYFRFRYRRGFFWRYLEYSDRISPVMMEKKSPCRILPDMHSRGLLYRVLYFKNRISLEVSHILTDGSGALPFFSKLLEEYCRLCEHKVEIPLSKDEQEEKSRFHIRFDENWRDPYELVFKKNMPPPRRLQKAARLKGKPVAWWSYPVIGAEIPADTIRAKAKAMKCSVGELIGGLFLFSLQMVLFPEGVKSPNRPIRLLVPVNLRNIYGRSSHRNFFLPVFPTVEPALGRFSLEEMIQKMHHSMRMTLDYRYINQQISRNVSFARQPLIRILPLFVKKPIERLLSWGFMGNRISATLTNLGTMPKDFNPGPLVRNVEVLAAPSHNASLSCGVVSYNNTLSIQFGSVIKNREVQKCFFKQLRQLDIPCRVFSN